MLETVLNVGMNNDNLRGLIRLTGNPRLAWDSYRRFIAGYAEVVNGQDPAEFETALKALIQAEGVASESELDGEALERLTQDFLDIAQHGANGRPPEAPMTQLLAAVRAVYGSWNSGKAVEYRRLNKLDDLTGTAVTVQAMVFGNGGGRSGAGVAFSRNPATGEPGLYVDSLLDAQGEDVVSGRRTPGNAALLAARLPTVAAELAAGAQRLEEACRDLQDIEFTVEEGRLFFLQTRAAKRTPRAALRVVTDLVREGVINVTTALQRVNDIDLDQANVTRFRERRATIAKAVSASPGVASGRVAFDSRRAKEMAADGQPVILVRHDTATEDVAGFAVASGILTAVGGRTSHAAVVARQLGKVCLVGCRSLALTPEAKLGELAGHSLQEGDWLSLDGDSGEISLGRSEIVTCPPQAELDEIAGWRARKEVATT
jgi:pyruvate,orthophosphate dikinase